MAVWTCIRFDGIVIILIRVYMITNYNSRYKNNKSFHTE